MTPEMRKLLGRFDVLPDGALSPELALVDPGLGAELRAVEARVAATAVDEAPTPLEAASSWVVGDELGQETRDAFQRIVALSEEEPTSTRPRLRMTKLAGALATWAMVGFLALDTLHAA
jgi:hypothetical protein